MQVRRKSHVRPFTCCLCQCTEFRISCQSVDHEAGTIAFTNGRTVVADLIVGADGVKVNMLLINSGG